MARKHRVFFPYWSSERITYFRQLWNLGTLQKVIAAEFGVSETTIRDASIALGLTPRARQHHRWISIKLNLHPHQLEKVQRYAARRNLPVTVYLRNIIESIPEDLSHPLDIPTRPGIMDRQPKESP